MQKKIRISFFKSELSGLDEKKIEAEIQKRNKNKTVSEFGEL